VDSGFGVGLDALTRRLRLLYGDAANVRAEREDTGFAVTVRMPA
jgi:LytS/YehU family sensor histidine kinase